MIESTNTENDKDTIMTEQELLKSLLAINVLKLNTLYEIREILSMQNNINPNIYATAVENTAQYSKTRENDILQFLQDN